MAGSVASQPALLCPADPTPSPGYFLEVLILEDLQLYISEVLILGYLQARLLILMDFKSCRISDLIKNDGFAEVLILEDLRLGTRTNDRT